MFKLFKGLFTMCQCTNYCLDIIERKQDATLKNQHLIHQRLHIEEPLEEVAEEEELPKPIDPFTFLTLDELAYFEMGRPHVGGDDGSDNVNDDIYEDDNKAPE
jgi:hypothetical protein